MKATVAQWAQNFQKGIKTRKRGNDSDDCWWQLMKFLPFCWSYSLFVIMKSGLLTFIRSYHNRKSKSIMLNMIIWENEYSIGWTQAKTLDKLRGMKDLSKFVIWRLSYKRRFFKNPLKSAQHHSFKKKFNLPKKRGLILVTRCICRTTL